MRCVSCASRLSALCLGTVLLEALSQQCPRHLLFCLGGLQLSPFQACDLIIELVCVCFVLIFLFTFFFLKVHYLLLFNLNLSVGLGI